MSFLKRGLLILGLPLVLAGWMLVSQADDIKSVSKLPTPKAISIEYSWVGLSPQTLHKTIELAQQPGQQMFLAKGTFNRINREVQPGPNSQGTTYPPLMTEVSPKQIAWLIDSLRQGEWKPTQKPGETISHTDDYPNLVFVFKTHEGMQYKLFSTSNTPTMAPWNLQVGDTLFTTTSPQVAQAIQQFYKELQPESWGK